MVRARWMAAVAAGSMLVSGCASPSRPSSGPAAGEPAPARPGGADGGEGPTTSRGPVVDDAPVVRTYAVPRGSRPHDVAPAADGSSVWYTAQGSGRLGRLDPGSGEITEIPLGPGSAPHGVIVGPDQAAWVTDGGLNAVVRVDPRTEEVTRYPMPPGTPWINMNTAVFGNDGTLWFTGQAGYYGRLDPGSGRVQVFDAPRGRGPYGITVTPDGSIYYASLAGNHIARIDPVSNTATVLEPPTAGQGARRVWADSQGRVWVSEWNAGQLGMYDPGGGGSWTEWKLPGGRPQAYAVYVDDEDKVWVTDFGGNAIFRFDPVTGKFTEFLLSQADANVRQLLGRPGQVWGAESGLDRLVVVDGSG